MPALITYSQNNQFNSLRYCIADYETDLPYVSDAFACTYNEMGRAIRSLNSHSKSRFSRGCCRQYFP